MNKFLIIAKSVITAVSMVGIASADTVFSHHSLLNGWTGFYVGANTGVVFNNTQLKSQQLGFTQLSDTCDRSSSFTNFFPGIQLGYMHQFPNYFVSGIETNLTLNSHQKENLSCVSVYNNDVSDKFTFRNQLQSSIKGRVGRALNWNNNIFLPYLTGGVSFTKVGLTYQNEGGNYYSKNLTSSGWLIGAGIEWAFRQHWSLRTEYFYANY